jgi:hypothetical protein
MDYKSGRNTGTKGIRCNFDETVFPQLVQAFCPGVADLVIAFILESMDPVRHTDAADWFDTKRRL